MRRFITRMLLGTLGVGACGLSGCAGTYDLLTSQRFRERPFGTIFNSEDPLEVLENNPKGDDRVRAIRRLEEPAKNGRPADEQERVMAILKTTATSDPSSLCRLSAVEALSRFEDPRCVSILLQAYQNAPYESPAAATNPIQPVAGRGAYTSPSSFTPETVKMLQCQVLEALGKHRHPDSLKLLCEVAQMPTEKPKPTIEQTGGLQPLDFNTTGLPDADRADVRLSALRSLGSYEGESLAIKSLVQILQTESDVALRGRAHDSLVSITGQDLPPDGAAWADWLAKDGKPRKRGLFR